MKVIVVNQFLSDNLGDKLIGDVLKQFFESKGIDVLQAGYAQTEDQSVKRSKYIKRNFIKNKCPNFIKYLMKYKKRIENEGTEQELSNAKALVIGGGQLLNHNSVFVYCFFKWVSMAKKQGVPVFVHGIGVNDNFNFIEKLILKRSLKDLTYINCRDANSKMNLQGFTSNYISVSPDVVFSLELKKDYDTDKYCILMPYCYDTAKKHFGVFKSRQDYYNTLLDIIEDEKDVVLTATTSSDLDECYVLRDYLMKHKVKCSVVECKTVSELIECFGKSNKIITGRMHALIVGELLDKKVIAIKISPKIDNFDNDYIQNSVNLKRINNLSKEGLNYLYNNIMDELVRRKSK